MEKVFNVVFNVDKSIYSKNALISTVYDFIDDYAMLLNSDDTTYIVSVIDDNNTFDKKLFLNKLNKNEMQEIVEERTGKIREAIYMASVTRGI